MTLTELFLSQLTDLFRIGLVVALVATAMRTRGQSGWWLPLAAGVVFVAVLLPLTIGSAVPLLPSVAVGVVSNAAILAVVLAAWAVFRRFGG